MRLRELTTYLESIAPLALQESYDNSGLLVGDPDLEVTSALITLDVTPEVIFEAAERGCHVVIGHHPVIFRGLKRLTGETYVERTVIEAIRRQIAIYAIHTNLDNVLQDGVNGRIAERLELTDLQVLAPREGQPAGIGAGVSGLLQQEMDEASFLAEVRKRMDLRVIRHTALRDKPVKRVAICGGSGSFLLQRAIDSGADVYISSDFKYHEFFDAEGRVVIMDIGHYESERFTIDLLGDLIRRKFPNFAAQLTSTVTNPISYYPW